MADKAQIERITQLTRLAGGQSTKRTPEEILEAERQAALKYKARPAKTTQGVTTPEE